MANISINLVGINLTSDIVEELSAILRPAACAFAEANLAGVEESYVPVEAGPREWYQSVLDSAKAFVDKGGRIDWTYWSVKASDGVEHDSEAAQGPVPPPTPGFFDGSNTATLRLHADLMNMVSKYSIHLQIMNGYGTATMTAPATEVRQLADVLKSVLAKYQTEPRHLPPFKVFIAYGGGPAWEAVRDYLNRAEIDVDAFTESERVGEVTIDVVSRMIRSASVAVIVMTASEQMEDGTWRARQNVVHEAGFSQGVLGLRDTIILLEEGVELPSNLTNVTYIPFPRGAVHSTEARVVARVREAMADRNRDVTARNY